MSDTTKTETTKAPEKKGAVAKLQAFVQYLINEPMFWRLIIFGYISTYIINHLYKKMDFLVRFLNQMKCTVLNIEGI